MNDLYFGRKNEDDNVVVLDCESGETVTIMGYQNIFPVGSDLSTCYEHAAGIVLTQIDTDKIGLVIE